MFRFFEAAARHLNFTRAAEEMHVTNSYFIVYPPASKSSGKIQVFQEWLFEQLRLGERVGAIGARAGKGVAGGTPRSVRLRKVASA
jgi:hypothetical protein